MAKEFRLDKVLSNYKCKKTESRLVNKDKYLSPAEIREFIDKCTDLAGHSTSAITADRYVHSKFEYDELKGYFRDFYQNGVVN